MLSTLLNAISIAFIICCVPMGYEIMTRIKERKVSSNED